MTQMISKLLPVNESFSAMHRLDVAGLDQIYVYELQGEDLAAAIMDRLLKAAAKRLRINQFFCF